MGESIVLLFMTTQAALQAEDALLEAGLQVDVVPPPKGLRGLCGIALEIPAREYDVARAVLTRGALPFHVYDGKGSDVPRRDGEPDGGS